MNCYRHLTHPAIAICLNCGKGVCSECCDDTGQGISCSQSCTEELQETCRLQARLRQSFGIGGKLPLPVSVPMYALFGLILLGVGIFLSYTRPGTDFLTFSMSAVFFVMSGASYKRYRDACMNC